MPWFALESLLVGDVAPMAPIVAAASRMASKPIVTVNLWYDRAVMDDVFVGLPGREMQWVFDKRRAFGEPRPTCHSWPPARTRWSGPTTPPS